MAKKTKRITVTVEVDVPVEWTIGETDRLVESVFPKTVKPACLEQRTARSDPRASGG